jgi:hypothetical protein
MDGLDFGELGCALRGATRGVDDGVTVLEVLAAVTRAAVTDGVKDTQLLQQLVANSARAVELLERIASSLEAPRGSGSI